MNSENRSAAHTPSALIDKALALNGRWLRQEKDQGLVNKRIKLDVSQRFPPIACTSA